MHFAQTLSPNDAGWEYFDAAQGRYRMQPMRSIVTVNGTDAYNAAAVAGLGLIQAPIGGLLPCFAAGSLVQVMPAFTARAMPVSLVYVNRRQLAPRVLAVMNWLTEILAPYFAEDSELAIASIAPIAPAAPVAPIVPSEAPADRAASPSRSTQRASRGASPAADAAAPRKRSRRPLS